MRAIVYRKFGPPDVLKLEEIATPVPNADELLIRIHATTVEVEDPGMRARPGFNGFFRPRHPILGMLFAGEIAEAGNNAKRFKKGDAVYGTTGLRFGACAEYLCVLEDSAVVVKPASLSFPGAAAILNGAITAIPFLREKARIQSGQRVLINGASGSVGTAALQIAKAVGGIVTGVCSTPNLELVTSIGADCVIDYTKQDFPQNGERYDIIFDVAGKSSFSRCKDSLTDNGVYLTTIPSAGVLFRMLTSGSKGKRAMTAATGLRSAEKKTKDLMFLNELIEAGKVKPVIDKTYPLEQTAEAHRYVETGKKRGAVVITV